MYQAREVAAVIATDRYIAADGIDAVEVEYEPLPVVIEIPMTPEKVWNILQEKGGGGVGLPTAETPRWASPLMLRFC